MDASGQPKPPKQSDTTLGQAAQTPDENTEKTEASDRQGRSITPEDAESIVAEARALAGPDQHQPQQAVSSRRTNAAIQKAGDALDESNDAIKKFIKDNKLNKKSTVEYDLRGGFSSKTRMHFIVMSQFKELIDQHTALLNQVYDIISPSSQRLKALNKAVRGAASSRKLTTEGKALLETLSLVPGIDERKTKYWQERAYIRIYSAFCKQRFWRSR